MRLKGFGVRVGWPLVGCGRPAHESGRCWFDVGAESALWLQASTDGQCGVFCARNVTRERPVAFSSGVAAESMRGDLAVRSALEGWVVVLT